MCVKKVPPVWYSPIELSVKIYGISSLVPGDLFTVDYFGKKDVFLGQTWQLYAEPAIFGLEKIYTISPSFRAEKSRIRGELKKGGRVKAAGIAERGLGKAFRGGGLA